MADKDTKTRESDARTRDKDANTNSANAVAMVHTQALTVLSAYKNDNDINLDMRIGGIYALEKIAATNEDYREHRSPLLCAYVRQQTYRNDASWKDASDYERRYAYRRTIPEFARKMPSSAARRHGVA